MDWRLTNGWMGLTGLALASIAITAQAEAVTNLPAAGLFSLQVGSYKEWQHAQTKVGELLALGLDAHLRRTKAFHQVFTQVGKNQAYLQCVKPKLDRHLKTDSLIRYTPTLASQRTESGKDFGCSQDRSLSAERAYAGTRVQEQRKTTSIAYGPAMTAAISTQPQPASKQITLGSCQVIEMEVGSLRENISRNIATCGFRMGLWKLEGEGYFQDWIIHHPYVVNLTDGEGVLPLLKFIDRNYSVRGTVNQLDQSIDFEPSGRNRKVPL